jgi:hypothetical protein
MSELDDLLDPGITNSNRGSGGSGEITNSVAVLVLGICSIVGCLFYAVPGLVCGIIALALFGNVKRVYLSNPSFYSTSYKNAHAGMICAIIGLSLSGLFILIFLFALLANGGF